MPGERVGEAVTEIQPGRVTSLAEVVEGLARQVGLLDSKRLDDDSRPAEKHIALADSLRPDLAFEND